MPASSVTFRRKEEHKPAGCLVYIVITPFIALFLALAVYYPLVWALTSLGILYETANWAFFILLPVMLIVVARRARAEFWERADSEVNLFPMRARIRLGKQSRDVAFEFVRDIRLSWTWHDMACKLKTEAGEAVLLPPGVAAWSVVCPWLDHTLGAMLRKRLAEGVDRGEVVSVSDSRARALLGIMRGLFSIAVAAVCVASVVLLKHGLVLGHRGLNVARQGIRGMRGGFELGPEGLRRRRRDGGWTAWSDLEIPQLDAAGLVVRSRRGGRFTASPVAEHYWAASGWLTTKLKEGRPISPRTDRPA